MNRGVKKLTTQQVKVLKMYSEGLSTGEIACEMRLSDRGVEFHRRKVSEKLKIPTASNYALMTRAALKMGITKL
jgi:DNA-binding NarL/FixJ family response regulator